MQGATPLSQQASASSRSGHNDAGGQVAAAKSLGEALALTPPFTATPSGQESDRDHSRSYGHGPGMSGPSS